MELLWCLYSVLQHNHVTVGKMDIVWRSRFGEKGRIQTGQLKSSVPPLPELKVTLIEAPGTVKLEQAFYVTCRVTNTRLAKSM